MVLRGSIRSLGFVFFFLLLSGVALGSVVVDIRVHSDVGSVYYTLGDIADISGGTRSQRIALASLRLGVSPPIGSVKRVSFKEIRRVVLRSAVDVREVVFKVPSVIMIRNAGTRVSAGRIYYAVLRYLSKVMPLRKSEYKVRLLPVPPVVVSAKGVTVEVMNGKADNWFVGGKRFFTVGFFHRGRLLKAINVGVEISFLQRIVIANRLIKWKQIIRSSDIKVYKRWVFRWHKGVSSASLVVGKMATRTILPGTVITQQMIDVPPVIHRGDIVRIVSIVGKIVVVAKGKARQSGKLGEKIIVRNLTSHRDVQGVVVDGTTVRVY